MRKEVILAVITGGFLGLVIAYGAWRANIALSSKSSSGQTKNPIATPASGELKITLGKPNDQDVITESPVTVSGVTQNSAIIIASGNDDDTVGTASSSGNFEVPIDLVGGINQLKVFTFNQALNQASANLLLVYSSSFSKTNSKLAENATPSASDIANKVQEKVKEALASSISYIGTVTDITDSSIQIKTAKGEISQVSPNKDNVTYIKSTADTTKEIKATDLAIGDFIVAMGTKNGNNVLHASRILVTDPVKEDKKIAVIGVISDTTKGSITIKDTNIIPDDNISITTSDNVKIKVTKFSSLDTDWRIIAVGTKDSKGNLLARRIHVLDIPTITPSPKPSPKS